MPTSSSAIRFILCSALLLGSVEAATAKDCAPHALAAQDGVELTQADEYTLNSPVHLVDGVEPIVGENSIRIVVEIPTGTTQKWEVKKDDGNLGWEFKNGKPRVVKYLGYPGNYGMVPGTLLSPENGGDGDPLDVLVLGPAVPRGAVIEVKIIGMLKMRDKGQQDDKLIAVMPQGVFCDIDTIKDLDREFPGVTTIVETWFANYKGKKKIQTRGYEGRKKAQNVLSDALEDYKKQTEID